MLDRLLTVDYLRMLLRAARTERDRLLLRLLYYAMLRPCDLAELHWRSVRVDDAGRAVVTIGPRAVVVPAWLHAQLIRFRAACPDEAPVFAGSRGRPLSIRAIHKLVARTARRARIPGAVSPHWLRHSAIIHARNAGAPIELVQRDAGHASIVTTARYSHGTPRDGASLHLPIL